MLDDEIRDYITNIVFDDNVLNSIGRDNVGMWMPLVKSKVDSLVSVTKNLDDSTRFKVLGVVAVKLRRLVLGINNAVRLNYSKGENAILKAIIELLSKGTL